MLNVCLPRFRHPRPLFSVVAPFLLSLTFGCSGGSSPTCSGSCAATPVAPSNLAYPQTSISAVMGQAVTSSTPTVSGTVTSYSISPGLPAGLTLNSSTGVISGTPTAAVPATTYTITASNSAGSTTATVQITVNVPPVSAPSGLSYSPSTILATVGNAIGADSPTVTGSVTSYSVAPVLPAGLSLNATTGAISGTPTAVSAQATYVVTASNASGSTTASLQITVNPTAPSGLSYSPSTISATVGQAIAADNPTVTGTVTSYSVAPALPAGLSLNATTGIISGTPTAAAAQATYVVTASNVTGSTTASVQITVNPAVAAPSGLGYPQGTITATVAKTIVPDFPSVTGVPTSYRVSPALPAGLSLDPLTGTIFGTPTATAAQASYTVTASNAGGSTTASVSVVVNKAYTTVLDLGHSTTVTLMRSTTDRVLSLDQSGHWALWDANADSELASGDQSSWYSASLIRTYRWTVDMAGPTIAVGQSNGLEVRSSTDGHLLSLIAAPNMIDPAPSDPEVTPAKAWWKLASDGSYICAGSSAGLAAWSTAGQLVLFQQGDYSSANVFAAPGQMQVALGAAGQNVIETISLSNGASSVGPAFSGSFNSWFLDGQRFLTNTGTTVWTYSASSVEQGVVSLPTVNGLTGQGNWLSIYQNSGSPQTVSIYALGASSPSATYTVGASTLVSPSGLTLGLLDDDGIGSLSVAGSVVDLSGSSPVKTDFTTPVSLYSAYTAASASKWFVANRYGVIVDGSSPNASQTLDLGQVWSIAGGTTKVAFSTANGLITTLNPAMPSATSTIAFPSTEVALSSDDTVLVAAAVAGTGYDSVDNTLKIFSLPSGSTTATFPYSSTAGSTELFGFSLSSDGTTLGQVTGIPSGTSSWSYSRTVGPVTGGPATWSDTVPYVNSGYPPVPNVDLSPDGTLIAAPSGPPIQGTTTNIIKNGTLVTAVPGWANGWLDNNSLLVSSYQQVPLTSLQQYEGAVIYDSTGAQLSTPGIPQLSGIQTLGGGLVYSPGINTVYSLSSGQPVWTATASSSQGAVAGSYVVFVSGNQVLLDTH